ncbi:MAG: GGDEF domain-containing protein [Sulfurimonas sp.]|nr:GGDEF domain-containing protein [Sulfurimonas sp.]MDD3060993.1 GGDEF domain-containing protein [Sulfurimonas sp.]MDD5203376.1 GGDEF domain-containing protein [Sulfurimonas sp.]
MHKDDLKSLVTQMYTNLLEQIDIQENASIEQVRDYLYNASNAIGSLDESKLHSLDETKDFFKNSYKELAAKSISSYQDTNVKFEQIAQLHEQTVNEYGELINIPDLTEHFNSIQTHMNDEVQKANSIILQLVEQVKKLEETSNLDSLTKVYNRRALSSYLSEICARKNINYGIHLLILDVDDFKVINDTFGHIAGDKILIFIANILKKTLRDGDKVFRYGGEEFVIVLNRITDEHCKNITLRILELIRKNKLIYKGQSINVTMSIGATKYKESDNEDTLMSRADKALYRAKNSGKNQMYSEI